MKLLIFTQTVDKKDTVLGFFHRWIDEFSRRVEKVTVVCLKEGEHDLPDNVKVLSLGKDLGLSKAMYVVRFYKYIISEFKNYDAVFVHMNQEYVLLGGLLWKFFGKKVFMWRNHHAGNILTDFAAMLCDKVYCTSKFSYTAKYIKTEFMPVGIDTMLFKKTVQPAPRSILFLARIAPIKKPDLLLRALGKLKDRGGVFSASIYGDALPKDREYKERLTRLVSDLGLKNCVAFYDGVPNDKTPDIYSAHNIFVNLSSSGMYDKTIFEAMACECLVLASNDNLKGLIADQYIFKEGDEDELVLKLEALLNIAKSERNEITRGLRKITEEHHSLDKLARGLIVSMYE